MSNIIEGRYVPTAEFSGSVKMPEWVKGSDGYTPVKGVDYWTDEELKEAYDYLVEKVATINWDDINIDMSDVIAELRKELAAVAFSNDYNDLENKPVIPSTVGLATEEYVNQKVSSIDLSNYVLASALSKVAKSGKYSDLTGVPTKLSQFVNDSGFLTQHQSLVDYAKKTYVASEIAKIPQPDLSGYAKKTDIPAPQDLSGYALKTEIPSVEGLATEGYVDEKIAEAAVGGSVDLSEYAKKTDIPVLPTFANVATSGSYNDLTDKPEIPVVEVVKADLEDFYKKNETYTKSEVEGLIAAVPKFKIQVEQVRPTTGDATTVYLIPSTDVDDDNMYVEYIYINNKWELLGMQRMNLTGMATEAWVESQGFLKEHQSLEGYVREEDISGFQTAEMVQAAITTALGNIGIAEEGTY